MNQLLLSIIVLLICSFQMVFAEGVLSKIENLTENTERVFELERSDSGVKYLISTTKPDKIQLYSFSNGKNSLLAERTADCYIEQATLFKIANQEKLMTTCGVSRGNLSAKLEVYTYSSDLKSSAKIYQFETERNETNFLKQIAGKIVINYFTSKYETATGYFSADQKGNWTFQELHRVRMATNLVATPDYFVFARMYGNSQGQDGDLLAGKPGEQLITLPSYRGVYSLASQGITNGKPEKIFIADGWHQNYGEFAQARLSQLTYQPNSNRYALEIVKIFDGSYAVTKIDPITNDKLLVVTNNNAFLAKSGKEWTFTPIAKQSDAYTLFNLYYLGQKGSNYYFLVQDGKVALFSLSSDNV